MSVRMEVRGVHVDPATNQPLLILCAAGEPDAAASGIVLPLWVGPTEANAISLALEGIVSPRPMTHDLLCAVIDALEARVVEVAIVGVEDATYHAEVRLEHGGQVRAVDARPSDAIAIATRLQVPILVEQLVLDRATSHDVGSEDPAKLAAWFAGMDVLGLDPDLS